MQLIFRAPSSASNVFQSSPVPEDGCNRDHASASMFISAFQSSPVPEDGCNYRSREQQRALYGFNPHPSRRTGATTVEQFEYEGDPVSILTRPGGRVQLAKTGDASALDGVSILTRPGGRVQLFHLWR